jgi:3-dehydroquinate synthetase
LNRAEIFRAMRMDKKRSDGQVRFSLPVRIGEVRTGIGLELSESMLEG